MVQKKKMRHPPALGQSMVDSIKVINRLSVEELIALNEMIVLRLKEIRREECVTKAQEFKVGDFVSFEDKARKREGIILRIHQRTIKVFTTEELSWRVSPKILKKINTPFPALEKLAQEIFPEIFS